MITSHGAPWLLYGAYGFTGRLLAHEAVRRDHRLILAGRDEERLASLGNELGCPIRVFPLDDPEAVRAGLEGVRAVLHAAGPFVHTSEPMVSAAIEVGAHYLDITGEVPVFEAIFARDAEAARAGVALLPGMGMDVIPTDAVAALLSRQVPEAISLALALHSPGTASRGTLRTVVAHLKDGLLVRRGGELRRVNPGRAEFLQRADFGPGEIGGSRWIAPYTWGDLSTAHRSTGIDDITCYMARSRTEVRTLPWLLPILRRLFSLRPVRTLAERRIRSRPAGPDSALRESGRTRIWGRVETPEGASAEMVLETMEGYRFTSTAAIRAIEALFERPTLRGALTPSLAFGPAWGLALPETRLIGVETPG